MRESSVLNKLVDAQAVGCHRDIAGKIGPAVGQQHLRSILALCNSPLMNAIEAYIQFTPGLITDDGEVTDDSVSEFLRNYMAEFHGLITRVYTVLPEMPDGPADSTSSTI